jgi:hypothetical protein|tara:strand:+ start:2578 stop:2679 length:102 start_codon:yes stop_codon:yes gene_type:complete
MLEDVSEQLFITVNNTRLLKGFALTDVVDGNQH